MLKISTAVNNILEYQPFLKFGFNHRIFNLSALAKFIKPLVESRTHKEIKTSAILMCLSRQQKKIEKIMPFLTKPQITNLTIHANLFSICFYTHPELFKRINQVYAKIKEKNGYINIIQGIQETSLIVDENFKDLVYKKIQAPIKNQCKEEMASLNIELDEKVYNTPGQFYSLIQAISFQGINIREITSAFKEVIIYVDQKDIKCAFDTIYNSFVSKKEN